MNKTSERIKQLYESMILDHNRNPRNFRIIENANYYSHGINPLCGDDYHVYLCVDANGMITDIAFHGSGCAISKSSGSLMSQTLMGKSIAEALSIKNAFLNLISKEELTSAIPALDSKLKIFENIRQFPARVKCAALAWRALEDALQDQNKKVSTE